MTQEDGGLDSLVRKRIRALRVAQGWSLEDLAERARLSSGTAVLLLGNRRFRVETNQAAEFPTMLPHAIGAEGGPCEILGIFDRDARRGHQRGEGADGASRQPA
jgi:transcriptional regulator with XRE-family HTH domain